VSATPGTRPDERTGLDGRTDLAFAAEPDVPHDAGAQDTGGRRAGAWWRRNRSLVAIGFVLLLGVALAVALTPRGSGDPLAPDNPAPEGSRAVAQVLDRQGVDVQELSVLQDVLAAAGPGTTLLVLQSSLLAPEQLRELRGSGADLVLVDPPLPVLQVLAPELSLGGTSDSYTAAPGCDDVDATAAGEARGGGSRYVAADAAPVPGVDREVPSASADVAVCYPPGSGTNPDAGSYAVVADPERDRRVVVHGQPDVLTNRWLAEEGNAALALRSLGRQGTLLWYRVDPFDAALDVGDGPAPSAVDLLPRWVGWAAVQLLVVAAVAVLWRFRRLGRLVPERLPAVVRSVETTEGRARLYRAAGARASSAQVLRRASSRRLATRLSTGSVSDPTTVARLAAAASGRDPVSVGLLLDGPAPTDDAGLVRLADDLDRLEREVSHR